MNRFEWSAGLIARGRDMLRVWVLLVASLGAGGCAEPAAVVQLLGASEEALAVVREGDVQLELALLAQTEQYLVKLDEAFASDMNGLADEQDRIALKDVLDGKSLYDDKRAALERSRANLIESFRTRRTNIQAARTLVRYAKDLVVRNRAAWRDTRRYIRYIAASTKTLWEAEIQEGRGE